MTYKAALGGLGLTCVLASTAFAQTDVKPEFMMIIDTSGSMSTSTTGSGNNSCGYSRTRINDAKCVFREIVDSTGDAIFGLEKFASQTCSGTCTWSAGGTCDRTANSGVVVSGISDGNANSLIPWVDNSCNSCTAAGGNPELKANGNTPLEGSLRAALSYYQGASSPINASDTFRQCRPHYVILLTDGDETCGGNPPTAATALRSTQVVVGGNTETYDIKTFVIGFGQTPCYGPLENIATAGGTDAPGACSAFYATDEQSLSLAMSQIIASSLLVEKCNGEDDNCNGQCDETFPEVGVNATSPSGKTCSNPHAAQTCTVGVGACQRTGHFACLADGSGSQCVDAQGNPLQPGPPGVETCPPNGIDDDCNGVVDDIPGGCPTPTPEVCNNQDDDQDGVIDEWNELFPCPNPNTPPYGTNCRCINSGNAISSCPGAGALPTNCGCLPSCGSNVGICQPGLLECLSGGNLTCVGGTQPTTETCNCLDDNCNGIVDDVPPATCYTGPAGTAGVGVCRTGITSCQCSSGVATTLCNGQVTPGPEIACNGLDDNCNGVVDEPQGQPCYPANTAGCTAAGGGSFTCVGACHAGTFQCQGGQLVCVGAVTPTAEICDGIDNNCDGQVDNFVCGQAQGICTAQCQNSMGQPCTAGQPCSCNTHVGATGEVCNGLDDDCDGVVDNNVPGFGVPCAPPGATCNLAQGTCCGVCTPGTLRCIGGQSVCDGAVGPRPETCNGVDDNCNCMIDDNVPGFGGSCGSNVGACRPGTFQCVNGMGQCTGATGPAPETCNNIDDDCDGVIDDNVPGVGTACFDVSPSVQCNLTGPNPSCPGICRPGTLICNSSASRIQCQGEIGPQPEVCNGLDDDCDGVIDNGFNVGGTCTVMFGTCPSTGHLICRPDGTGTTCNAPPVSSSPETCNGLDDNCNGIVDEPYGIWPCPTSAPNPAGCICPTGRSCGNTADLPFCYCPPQCGIAVGQCQAGHLDCQNGQQVCVGGTQPSPEICNCLDDNCNGIVDDNPMGEGDACPPLDMNGNPITNVTPPSACRNGHKHCTSTGQGMCGFVCEGAIGPSPEICDGIDNDCDGMIDNGATCPPMHSCVSGSCQPNCQVSEFACTSDRRCVDPSTGNECTPPRTDCVCLPNVCLTANCDPNTQDCIIQNNMATCRDRCQPNQCQAPTTCDPHTGHCIDCFTTGCPQGQVCTGSPGMCVTDPCFGVQCQPGEFCRAGQCVSSCPAGCPQGQVCQDGNCVTSRCDGVHCDTGQICNPNDGTCQNDMCTLGCPLGQRCVPQTGQCIPDPCATVHCDMTCYSCTLEFDGTPSCTLDQACTPPPSITATGTGGGGLSCAAGGDHDPPSPLWLLVFGLALAARRRGR